MNINKDFIEVFDIFTNDYKIIERKDYNKSIKKGFIFSKRPPFFQKRNDFKNNYEDLCEFISINQNYNNFEINKDENQQKPDSLYESDNELNFNNEMPLKKITKRKLNDNAKQEIVNDKLKIRNSDNDIENDISELKVEEIADEEIADNEFKKHHNNESDDTKDSTNQKSSKGIEKNVIERNKSKKVNDDDECEDKFPQKEKNKDVALNNKSVEREINSDLDYLYKTQRESPVETTPLDPIMQPTTTVSPTLPPLRQSQQPDFNQSEFSQPDFVQQPRPPFSPVSPQPPRPQPQPPRPQPQPPRPQPQPTRPQPPRPQPPRPFPPPSPSPFPPQTPASQRAILLINQLYYELGNLQNLYQQLALIAPDINTANLLNSYANETIILRQAVFEIYRSLTGRTLFPTSINFPLPILTGNFCTDLVTVYNYATSIQSTILQLLRIIDVNAINRQLTIISVTLNNQINGLNNLFILC